MNIITDKKNISHPENHNCRWNDIDIKNIFIDIKNNKSFQEIAISQKRSEGSITSKLLTIAYQLVNIYEIDINLVATKINMSVDTISDYIKFKLNHSNDLSDLKLKNNVIKEESLLNISSSTKLDLAPAEIILNTKQSEAFDKFKEKKNIFITGPGGTGKSIVVSEIIKYCKKNDIKVGVTATTGSAAILIGGKTLHSYLGIGLAEKSAKDLYTHNRYHLSHVVKKLKDLEVLIIDEISMLDLELFEKVSCYLSLIKFHKNPFGNIQIVLTGDFCQLEPVNGNYCFLSSIWTDLNLDIIFLNKMVRQENDKVFQKILREVRYGICKDKTFEILKNCNNVIIDKDIKPTILYSKNIDVDKINKLEYNKLIALNKKIYKYEIKLPEIKKNHDKITNWIKSLDIPVITELCIDAQIMVTANVNQDCGIINGTRGVITELYADKIIIKTINDNIVPINYHKCIYS